MHSVFGELAHGAQRGLPSGRVARDLMRAGLVAGLLLLALAWVVFNSSRESVLDRARTAARAGQVSEATRLLSQHLDRHSDDVEARVELGILLKAHEPAAALAHLTQIPRTSPRYAEAARHATEIALLTGRGDQAEQLLLDLERLDSNDHAVQLSLAELYYARGDDRRALPYARRAADLQPDRARTHLLIAEILDNLSRRSELLEPLRNAVELDPDLYEARINLAYAELFAGNLDRAEEVARQCLADREDASAYRFLAAVARARGDVDEAIGYINRSLELNPASLEALLLKADLLLFTRRADEAYALLEPRFEQYRRSRRFLGTMARAAAASGRIDEARRHQQSILELISQDSTSGLQSDTERSSDR